MGWIFVDKESSESKGQMRSNMRDRMRGGRFNEVASMRDNYEQGYREGYKHGWEDSEDEEGYRRTRDSRGRYM